MTLFVTSLVIVLEAVIRLIDKILIENLINEKRWTERDFYTKFYGLKVNFIASNGKVVQEGKAALQVAHSN